MPIIKEIEGDIIELALEGEFDAIVHGCNCRNRMGAGIAPKIAKAFKGVREADTDFYVPVGSVDRLGKYSTARQPNGMLVINAYTQFTYTGRQSGKVDVSYDAISEVFTQLNTDAYVHPTVGIPLIGAGLAGGDWDIIKELIDEATPDLDITLVIYNKDITYGDKEST